MFNIDTSSDKPIYEQIIDNVKELSLKKILKAEDKLPSVRQMASMLTVNPNTVSKAYQELERQKIIHTLRGRGTFISSGENIKVDKDRIEKAVEGLRNICIELGHLGFDKEKIIKEVDKIYTDIEKRRYKMIEVIDVSKDFGDFKALDNVNIKIKRNYTWNNRENGAGKTTLLQMLAGVYDVEQGKILMDGESIYDNIKTKGKIGYVADRNQYFRDYKISEIVGFYDGIYEDFSKDDFIKYNEVFQLDCSKKIKQLSKGMQMRLSLMLNLSIRPEVLILDEPTSGLDAIVKKELIDILINQVYEEDVTIIISSHHIGELEKICDEVTILNRGKVKYQSNIEEIKKEVKKLQVVFKEDIGDKINSLEDIINIEKVGSVYYLITDNYSEKLIDSLKSLGAELIENIGLSLEEIFIYTNKSRDKDRSEIDE